MTDTPAEILRLQARIIRQKPLAVRLQMVCEMADGGQQMVLQRLRQHHPDWTIGQLKAGVFRRIYRDDFTADELDRIAVSIEAWHNKLTVRL